MRSYNIEEEDEEDEEDPSELQDYFPVHVADGDAKEGLTTPPATSNLSPAPGTAGAGTKARPTVGHTRSPDTAQSKKAESTEPESKGTEGNVPSASMNKNEKGGSNLYDIGCVVCLSYVLNLCIYAKLRFVKHINLICSYRIVPVCCSFISDGRKLPQVAPILIPEKSKKSRLKGSKLPSKLDAMSADSKKSLMSPGTPGRGLQLEDHWNQPDLQFAR